MRIDILTVLPEMIEGMINCSIVKRAQDKGLAEIHLHNLRDYTTNKWRRVDDYPFGGEAGMVMQIEPIDRAISALKSEREYDEVIYTSPDGETLNQPMANSMSLLNNMIILCGHYKGIDYRTRPADYKGWKVPEVLLSGHQRKIEEWRLQQAQERTARLRPDLLK